MHTCSVLRFLHVWCSITKVGKTFAERSAEAGNGLKQLRLWLRDKSDSHPRLHRWLYRIPVALLGVNLYYLDTTSDLVLMQNLYETGNPIWATETACFVCLQFLAAWLGILFYLKGVYGWQSIPFMCVALHGLPCLLLGRTLNGVDALESASMPALLVNVLLFVPAPLLLDLLMFVEALELLWILPASGYSGQLKVLVPAYRSTRTLLEVTLEGLPQSILQGYIYYRLETAGADAAGNLANVSREALCALPRAFGDQLCQGVDRGVDGGASS